MLGVAAVVLVLGGPAPASHTATPASVTIDRLDGGLDATHWRFTATGKESTQLEYKYTLGSFDYVEKGAACDEIANRQLTLT